MFRSAAATFQMKAYMVKRFIVLGLILMILAACGNNSIATSSAAKTAVTSSTAAATGSTSSANAGSATDAVTGVPTQLGTQATGGSGSMSFSGGFALYALMQTWSEEYAKIHPDVKFDIQAGGAGKGMTDMLAGAVNVALLTREVRKEETDNGAKVFPVAIDAVVFTYNAENPVAKEIAAKGLAKDALARIYIKGEKLTWGQLLGTDDKSPINVYTRADSSGAAEQVAIYLGGKSQDDLKGVGNVGDPGLLQAVQKDPLGIGFNSISFAYDPSTGNTIQGINVVPLDQNANGNIDDNESFYATQKDLTTAVAAGKYPSPPVRTLYLATKGGPTGPVRDFIKWALTDGQAFVEPAGFVKLSPDKIKTAVGSLK
jgi:phosphate transport system substrate-binding protein